MCDPVVAVAMLGMCVPAHLKILKVRAGDEQVTRQLLHMSPECCNLTSLCLAEVQTDDFIVDLLKHCPRIQSLELHNCLALTDGCADSIPSLSHLSTLNIIHTNFTDSLLLKLAERCRDTLQALHIQHCYRMSGEGVRSVLTHCHKLHTIHVSEYEHLEFDVMLMANITTLGIVYDCFLAEDNFEPFMSHLRHLQHMTVTAYALEIDTFVCFNTQTLPNLRTLHLTSIAPADNNTGDALVDMLHFQLPAVAVTLEFIDA